MARWLSLRLARSLGIAANVRFPPAGSVPVADVPRPGAGDVPTRRRSSRASPSGISGRMLAGIEVARRSSRSHDYLRGDRRARPSRAGGAHRRPLRPVSGLPSAVDRTLGVRRGRRLAAGPVAAAGRAGSPSRIALASRRRRSGRCRPVAAGRLPAAARVAVRHSHPAAGGARGVPSARRSRRRPALPPEPEPPLLGPPANPAATTASEPGHPLLGVARQAGPRLPGRPPPTRPRTWRTTSASSPATTPSCTRCRPTC